MRSSSLARWSVALACLAWACSGGGPAGPGGGGGGGCLTVIGPAGGTACLGTEVSVVIPPGALGSDTVITITAVAMPADLQAEGGIGQAYRVSGGGAGLSAPLRVTIFVPSSALGGRPIAQATLRRSTVAASLVPAGVELGSISRTTDEVSGSSSQFGVFAAALPPLNAAPTANAGSDQSVQVGATVNLTGTGTDPDGDPLTFSWSFQSRPAGSAAALANPNAAHTTFTADIAGNYDLRLTVNDGQGHTATDDVRVTASAAANRAPVANAGPDQNVTAGAVVILNGSASSDPDGNPLIFTWIFLSRPAGSVATLLDNNTAAPTFTADVAGAYDIQLTVSDGTLSSTDLVRVTAAALNRAPILNLTAPAAVYVGSSADVTADVSDPDGDPVSVSFTLVMNPGGATLTTNGNTATLSGGGVGTYQVRAVASDGKTTTEATVNVAVNPHVNGSYGVTVFADPSSCGESPDTQTGTLPVLQPSAGTVVLDLPSASNDFKNQLSGSLMGETYFYSGPIKINVNGSDVTVNGTVNGTISAGGQMNLSFSVPLFGSCVVVGTITGSK